MKAALIAAPMTGSGKTTVTLGLLSVLASRGFKVQPFKVGPDFIDPGLHELAAGLSSHNLDGWMLSKEVNRQIFENAAADKDVAIVEGVMGLYDGFDGSSNAGSTAEMSQWLGLPVILVVDAHPLARSAAALIQGFKDFDRATDLAGIIFNRVAGESHFRILEAAVKDVPIIGWLPSDPQLHIPERHLGLFTAAERQVAARITNIRDCFNRYLDIDRVLTAIPERNLMRAATPSHLPAKRIRVALARDAAFSFYYQANRIALELQGAEILEFSPLEDPTLPMADLLYIGGGYPELYRAQLQANESMRQSVRRFIEDGGRFYAECGGLMYLAQSIEGSKMVGILPTEIRLSDRLVNFGYCDVTTTQPSILGPAGTRVRGHQFHYSRCEPLSVTPVYAIRQGAREYGEGWVLPNGLASYVHLHFLSNPTIVRNVLES